MKTLVLASVLFTVLMLGNSFAQDTDYVAMSYPGAGSQGFMSKVESQLAGFLNRVDATNAEALGFSGAFTSHSLGDPIPVAIIGLMDSTEQAARSASSVIHVGQVPVYQNGIPGASLEITGSLPKTGRFGYAGLTRRILFMMDSLAYFGNWRRNTMYVVRLPAYNLVFVARKGMQTGEVYLTPVYDYPDYGLAAGVEAPLGVIWSNNLMPQFGDRSNTRLR